MYAFEKRVYSANVSNASNAVDLCAFCNKTMGSPDV